jgi:UDP-N-acetylglucosamine--N-acetylmuramyl-(pentapeptide) pyrophosphoryl-undecaprenol N-acetylglucosamine transferase
MAGVPLIIHEQNAVPGMTNKLLSRIASRVLEAFPGTFPASKRVVLTGNPVRSEIRIEPSSADRAEFKQPLHLLVLGGSRGAVAINQLFPGCLEACRDSVEVEIWHQTGRNDFQETLARYRESGLACDAELNEGPVRVVPFIRDMHAAYGWADVVLCRAGALTIAELASAGLPSILVPFPHAVDDHQTRNAEYLQKVGGAMIVPQRKLDISTVKQLLMEFDANRSKLHEMGHAARSMATQGAAEAVMKQCIEVINDQG